MKDSEKLHKILARAGFGSRRELERWIADGRITVNGTLAKIGDRVTGKEKIAVDKRVIKLEQKERDDVSARVLLYHKPEGEVVSRNDPQGRANVFQHLPKMHKSRWIAVGRLDINTAGVLLMTNDGELANRLMHPSFAIEREYAVRVLGHVNKHILQRLQNGVELEDGNASFDEVVDAGGSGANHWYHVTLKEGRNHEVRRLWNSQGLQVSRLIRIRFGPVTLPRFLRKGKWFEITGATHKKLLSQVELCKPDKKRKVIDT